MGKRLLQCSFAGVALLGLSACDTLGTAIYGSGYSSSYDYATYDYNYSFDGNNYYYSNDGYHSVPRTNRGVSVPNSYHVGQYRSPQSHKSRDKQWVKKQNPNSYTIEVSNGKKPATVAKTLNKAPKDNRRAQIKYKKNGNTYYKGVYGSYNSKQDALRAMNKLPADVRAKAGVRKWGKVQSKTNSFDSGSSYNLPQYND